MYMQVEETRQLLKDHGWTFTIRERRGKNYLYARRWAHKERYISSLAQLPKLKVEDVLEKIKVVS